MRIIVEADPGIAGRSIAKIVADKIKSAVPDAEVVIAVRGRSRE